MIHASWNEVYKPLFGLEWQQISCLLGFLFYAKHVNQCEKKFDISQDPTGLSPL